MFWHRTFKNTSVHPLTFHLLSVHFPFQFSIIHICLVIDSMLIIFSSSSSVVLPVSVCVYSASGVSASRSASVSSCETKEDGLLLRDDEGQDSEGVKFRLRSGRVLETRTRSFPYSSAARRSKFLYLMERGEGILHLPHTYTSLKSQKDRRRRRLIWLLEGRNESWNLSKMYYSPPASFLSSILQSSLPLLNFQPVDLNKLYATNSTSPLPFFHSLAPPLSHRTMNVWSFCLDFISIRLQSREPKKVNTETLYL